MQRDTMLNCLLNLGRQFQQTLIAMNKQQC